MNLTFGTRSMSASRPNVKLENSTRIIDILGILLFPRAVSRIIFNEAVCDRLIMRSLFAMAPSEPVIGPTEALSDNRGLIIGLSAAGVIVALAAGAMLWASQGDGVFLTWVTAAIAGCF
ncbi:hypothetical protein [Chelatococcus asaccharovorans]|nr:hypothetical protein [Chelatococcus asaccharovorans]